MTGEEMTFSLVGVPCLFSPQLIDLLQFQVCGTEPRAETGHQGSRHLGGVGMCFKNIAVPRGSASQGDMI